MNAQTYPTSSLTTVAITNEAALRVLAEGPIIGAAAVAHASGLAQKNMARQLDLLKRDGLVREEAAHDDRGRDAVSFNLTDAGCRALQAMDLAAGKIELRGAGAAEPSNDVLSLLHHQIRRNPLNARRLDLANNPQHRLDLDGLKAQIVAAGDVLQNLVVFPGDAEGIHDLFAGERRWTAVGELIEEGQWPRDRPLRAIQREPTPGQTAFISLVENSQVPLTVMERARAYETLCADTGWSGREAALRTGWDVKSVQQYLQVLRKADPAHIAAHDAGDPDWKWEALRDSVKERAEAGEEPAQVDLEEAEVGDHADIQHFSAAVKEAAIAADRAKKGDDRILNGKLSGTTTVEGESWPLEQTEVLSTDWKGYPQAKIGLTVSDRGRWHVTIATQAGGPGYSGRSGPPWVYTSDPIFLTREAALKRAAEAIVLRLEDWGRKRNLQNWLASLTNPPAPAAPRAGPTAHFGGGASMGVSKPKAEPVQRELTAHEALTLLELAHATDVAVLAGKDLGGAWVKVGKYWLDAAVTDLRNMGLVVFSHQHPNGPHAGVLAMGRTRLQEITYTVPFVTDEDLADARWNAGHGGWEGPGYVTPWLNPSAVGEPAGEPPSSGDTREKWTQEELAEEARREIAERRDDEMLDLLVEQLRDELTKTQGHPERWSTMGSVEIADAAIAAVREGRALDAIITLAALLKLEAARIVDADSILKLRQGNTEDATSLLALKVGDLVSAGGTASAYRLLERSDNGGHSQGFMAQQVRLDRGKDYGKPRHITLHAIQSVLPAEEEA